MSKKIIFLLCFLLFISSIKSTFWADDICGTQKWYDLYECRVENICREYESEKPVFNSTRFQRADDIRQEFQNGNNQTPAIENAKKIYRDNMSSIYKCAIIQSQRNSLSKLSDFIKQESSSGLADALWGQIDQRIHRLELSSNSVGCTLSDNQTEQNKLNILRETTQQLCIYSSYLEYVKWYYEQTGNSYNTANPNDSQLSDTSYDSETLNSLTKTTPREVANSIIQAQNEVAREISHTYKTYPIAFHAYSEYENIYPIHFLLEVIRGDFLILRKLLYQNLLPIAQLWLKIINAMSF